MILATSSWGRDREFVDEAERVGHALGVGVVRAEQHPVGPEQLHQTDGVLLVERVDVDVPLEHLDRVLVEGLGGHRVGVLHVPQQGAHPAAAVLDRGEPEGREPAAQAVADERGDGVGDGPALWADDGLKARAPLERGHLVGDALPLVDVPLVTAVRGVHPDRDVGLVHQLPERVELGEGRGAWPQVAGHRGGPDEDDLGPAVEHPLELLDGLVHDAQMDHRGGEDAVLVVERPVLGHPLVEGVDDGVGGQRVARGGAPRAGWPAWAT